MVRNRKCGDNPWASRWFIRQNRKAPKYFCTNCFNLFRTGRFSHRDSLFYDDVCPNCGAIGLTFEELADEYKDLALEYQKLKERKK